MSEVENLIDRYEGSQREVMLYFHNLLVNDFNLTAKITFGNPCYYRKSWICYLKPTKQDKVELTFLRGNELSNVQGILKSNGRKQLRSIEMVSPESIQPEILAEIFHESILLDETKPYGSKRKKNKK